MPILRLAVLGLLLAAPAAARQEPTPEQFPDLAAGRTPTFVDARFGDLVGRETFLAEGRTIWVRDDGSCALGTVTIRDGAVCFDHDDEPPGTPSHWWHPFRLGLALDVDDADPGADHVQRVTEIVDEPLSCGPPGVS